MNLLEHATPCAFPAACSVCAPEERAKREAESLAASRRILEELRAGLAHPAIASAIRTVLSALDKATEEVKENLVTSDGRTRLPEKMRRDLLCENGGVVMFVPSKERWRWEAFPGRKLETPPGVEE